MDQVPLYNGTLVMEKFPGKGGWTFVAVPGVSYDKSNPFGWVQVRGNIDSFEFNHYKLMPRGDGSLFLPVRADIRKKLKKEAGDSVSVTLFLDSSPVNLPEEIKTCLLDAPGAFEAFKALASSKQKHYLDTIYSAKTEDTKVKRIVEMIDQISSKP